MDRTVFQQMGLGKLDIHMQKNEVAPSPNTICKVKIERASWHWILQWYVAYDTKDTDNERKNRQTDVH